MDARVMVTTGGTNLQDDIMRLDEVGKQSLLEFQHTFNSCGHGFAQTCHE